MESKADDPDLMEFTVQCSETDRHRGSYNKCVKCYNGQVLPWSCAWCLEDCFLLVCLITEHKHPCLGCHYSPIPKPSSFTCVVSPSPSLSLLIHCGLACLLPWVCTPPGQRLKPLPYVFPVLSTMPGSWTLSVNQC